MVLKDLRHGFSRDPETIWGARKLLTPWTDRQQPGSRSEESPGPITIARVSEERKQGLWGRSGFCCSLRMGCFTVWACSQALIPRLEAGKRGGEQAVWLPKSPSDVSFVFRWDTLDVVSLSPGGSGRALGSCVSIPERGLWSEQQPCLDSSIASLEVWVKPMGCGSLPLNPSFFCTALWLCDLERRHATFPWCLCKMAGCKCSQSLFLFTLSLLGVPGGKPCVLAASQGRTAL